VNEECTVVGRQLRFEKLELRRLFAIDLELDFSKMSFTTDSSSAAIYSAPGFPVEEDEPIEPLTEYDTVLAMPPPLDPGSFDVMGSPFLVETDDHWVIASPNYQSLSTDLLILNRMPDGTAIETATLSVDLQVDRLLRLGDKVVVIGTKYHTASSSEIRNADTRSSEILVLDSSSQTVVYEHSLSGFLVQAIELPDAIAFGTAPWSHFPEAGEIESNYELGYLVESETGFTLAKEKMESPSTIAYCDGDLITITQSGLMETDNGKTTLRRWSMVDNQLQETASWELSSLSADWEYLQSVSLSPDHSQLLVSRASQELLADDTWMQMLTLEWFQNSADGISLVGSFTLDSFIGSALWMDQGTLLLLSNEAPAEVKILDIRDASEPILTTIELSQRLQIQQAISIDDHYLALFGYTPVTPIPLEGDAKIVPMVVRTPPQGAIVVMDLRENKITDERIFEVDTLIEQPSLLDPSLGLFSWHSMTTQSDWSMETALHVGKIDEQGKLNVIDTLSLGSDWTYQRSTDSTVTILSNRYVEERAWSDLDQVNWRVEFKERYSEPLPDPEPIEGPVPVEGRLPVDILRGEKLRDSDNEITQVSLESIDTDNPMDTNGDGIICPIDVLQIINYINRAYAEDNATELLTVSEEELSRFDVDGDTRILPSDAMMMMASLNVVFTSFELLDDASFAAEYIEEDCFWDMVSEEYEFPAERLEASMETLFSSLMESPETSAADDFWNWFAPWDPWADKVKQHWNEFELEPEYALS
jgi:hypothetical protein